MKKFKLVVVAFLAALLWMPYVNAECDAAESNKLSSLANNVRSSQDVIEKEVDPDPDWNPPDGLTEEEMNNYVYKLKFFRIFISNITEDLYVTVTNNTTKATKTFNYSDTTNGTVSFDEEVGFQIINYTVDVYASSNTGCASKKLRTFYVTTPKYNTFSEYSNCEGIREFYLCHEYLSVEADTTLDKFISLTDDYRAGKIKADGSINDGEKKDEGLLGFIKNHKGTVIGASIVVIAIGGLVIVIIVKKQRSRIV